MEQKFFICKHCGKIIAVVKETNVPVICCGEKMEEILRNYQLPISADISADALLEATSVDKKSEGQKLHLILLSEIGNAEIVDIPKQELII